MANKKMDLLALASIPLVMTLGSSMFIPVLPTIENKLGITPLQSSLIITVYSMIAIILIPISGYLSDKIGRKKVIIPSLFLTAIGGGIAAFASWKMDEPYYLILLGRFIQGIGASGAFPVVIPTVGDLFKNEENVSKGLGIIETANTFGKVLSPILGSLFATIVWFFPFVTIPIICFLSIILVAFFVKTPNSDKEQKQSSETFIHELKKTFHYNNRWLISTFLIGCISMFILFGFQFHFSNLLENSYDIRGIARGALLAIPLLFLCIASFFTGQKIKKNKKLMKRVIFVGYTFVFASLLFVKDDTGLITLISLLTIASIGIGISLPCLDSLITEGIKKEERGTVSSFFSSMRFIGVAAGPFVIAILMDKLPDFIYPGLAGLGALAALITIFAIKPGSKPKQQNGLFEKLSASNKHPSLFVQIKKR